MAKGRKSPQQKKQFELTKDHYTFGEHSSRAFPKTWKRKKTHVNRQLRRKSDALLAQAKPEMPACEVELIAGDITPARLSKSVFRKRLRKTGTVAVGEKIRIKFEKRNGLAGRRVRARSKDAAIISEALTSLISLEGEALTTFLRRAVKLLHGGDPIEWARVS